MIVRQNGTSCGGALFVVVLLLSLPFILNSIAWTINQLYIVQDYGPMAVIRTPTPAPTQIPPPLKLFEVNGVQFRALYCLKEYESRNTFYPRNNIFLARCYAYNYTEVFYGYTSQIIEIYP